MRRVKVEKVAHGKDTVNITLTDTEAALLIERLAKRIASKRGKRWVRITVWSNNTFTVW